MLQGSVSVRPLCYVVVVLGRRDHCDGVAYRGGGGGWGWGLVLVSAQVFGGLVEVVFGHALAAFSRLLRFCAPWFVKQVVGCGAGLAYGLGVRGRPKMGVGFATKNANAYRVGRRLTFFIVSSSSSRPSPIPAGRLQRRTWQGALPQAAGCRGRAAGSGLQGPCLAAPWLMGGGGGGLPRGGGGGVVDWGGGGGGPSGTLPSSIILSTRSKTHSSEI